MPVFLRPIGDDVIIHPFEYPEKFGSLYVPNPSKKRVNQGIIIAKGPLVSEDLDTTDHVFFNGYTGDKIALESSGEFFVIPESHIICKVERSDVVLMDTETVKRIIGERFGELASITNTSQSPQEFLDDVEKTLIERIESITVEEGWEF